MLSFLIYYFWTNPNTIESVTVCASAGNSVTVSLRVYLTTTSVLDPVVAPLTSDIAGEVTSLDVLATILSPPIVIVLVTYSLSVLKEEV